MVHRSRVEKQRLMMPFFDDMEQRLAFLAQLEADGHQDEALTLCLVHIDRFAQWLRWPSTATGPNFVSALVEFGRQPVLGRLHPLQFIRALRRMKHPWPQIAEKIETVFPGPNYEVFEPKEFVPRLSFQVQASQLLAIEQELWRGTIANVAYTYLRNPAVHGFGASPSLSFDQTSYRGEEVPALSFALLHPCAGHLLQEGRRRTEETVEWFGNDAVLRDA